LSKKYQTNALHVWYFSSLYLLSSEALEASFPVRSSTPCSTSSIRPPITPVLLSSPDPLVALLPFAELSEMPVLPELSVEAAEEVWFVWEVLLPDVVSLLFPQAVTPQTVIRTSRSKADIFIFFIIVFSFLNC
jgi:hypothetical protein